LIEAVVNGVLCLQQRGLAAVSTVWST